MVGRQREGHRRVAGRALGVAELVGAARDPVVQLDRDLGLQEVLVIVEQALDQLARAPPVAGVEQQVGELAAGRRIVRIELDRAAERAAGGGGVAELDRELGALQQVAAQPAGLLGRAHSSSSIGARSARSPGSPVSQHSSTRASPARVFAGSARRASRYSRLARSVSPSATQKSAASASQRERSPVERRPPGGVDQQRDRRLELAAVAQQRRQAVDRRHQIGVVGARPLVQRLRLVVVVLARDVGGAEQHGRAPRRLADQPGEPLERQQRRPVGVARPQLQPGQRVDHVEVIGLEPVGLAVGVERAGVVAELALVDQAELAVQLGALAIADVHRAAAQQIDQRRPLALGAVEQLQRLVRGGVGRRDRQHALQAVGGAVAEPELLPRRGDLGEPARAGVVGRVDQRGPSRRAAGRSSAA